MYSYITEELPDTVFKNFPEIDAERVSITGHSMGGHGALTLVGLFFSALIFCFYCTKKSWRRLTILLYSKRREKGSAQSFSGNKMTDKTSKYLAVSRETVPQKPHQVQICLSLRPNRQPVCLPLGSKSFLRLLWHGQQCKMG